MLQCNANVTGRGMSTHPAFNSSFNKLAPAKHDASSRLRHRTCLLKPLSACTIQIEKSISRRYSQQFTRQLQFSMSLSVEFVREMFA